MMKNKKLRLIVILSLVIQIILPVSMLGYHYCIYSYAMNNTPDFKFYLSYFDLHSFSGNRLVYDGENEDSLYFQIAGTELYRPDEMVVTVNEKGFAVDLSPAENKALNKHWFSYKHYCKIGSFSQKDGEFTYADTEEAKKVLSEWEAKEEIYFDIIAGDLSLYEQNHKEQSSVYITAKVYKGIFIPTAVYKDNVKIIQLHTEK